MSETNRMSTIKDTTTMTAGDLADLMDWDAVADLGVAPDAQVTILADGTVNALECGSLIADVAHIHGAELEYVRAGEYGCAYCSAEMLPYAAVPAASDDATWARLAALHSDGCAWVTTRANRLTRLFTAAAIRNIEETSADVAADVAALRSGAHTRESLLAHCLDGADDDRAQGWREYVDAVVAAAE